MTTTKEKEIKQPPSKHHIQLTSAEIANIWTSYMNDSMTVCMLASFKSHIQDQETQSILDYALQLSQAHIQKLKSFFTEEDHPIPDGFTEQTDLYKDAPCLFSDEFYLFYLQNLGKSGLGTYTNALTNSARLDICEYFTECLNESSKLFNKASEVMLSKGTFIRSPYIPASDKVEYVHQQSYLAGWFERRPLNVVEISNIYFNFIQNQLGRTLLMGFSQVAKSNEVRDYMSRGRDISNKHVDIFHSLLFDEFLPTSSAWSTMPTDSTVAPVSEKLMMFHTLTLNGAGIAFYGRSLATSPRRDLSTTYVRLMAEIGKYAEDGANIMIQNGWLEQPPSAPNRNQLVKGE